VDTYLQVGLDALGDGTRMAIFQKLASGPLAVHELAEMLPVSRPAVSQHLRVLKDAGLIRDNKAGTRRVYQVDPAGVARLRAHFDQVWDKALSAFQTAAERAAEKAVPRSARQGSPNTRQHKTGEKDDKTRRKRRRS
jgi:DNA-binding transcriptional ArsR family regulator